MKNRLIEQLDRAPGRTRPAGGSSTPVKVRGEGAAVDVQAWLGKASELIKRHPAVCLGAAVAGGVLLGLLIKRKR